MASSLLWSAPVVTNPESPSQVQLVKAQLGQPLMPPRKPRSRSRPSTSNDEAGNRPLSEGRVMAPSAEWSAWSEDDADSDPSDPGVSHCTEWFIGRWPVGAEEPDCRVFIGSERSAEIIARRVAEKLTSILNTDLFRSTHAGTEAKR